jgi:hypothetical protein
MSINSFLGRVIETTLVHLTAGAASKGVEKILDPATDELKKLYRKFRKPTVEEKQELIATVDEGLAVKKKI